MNTYTYRPCLKSKARKHCTPPHAQQHKTTALSSANLHSLSKVALCGEVQALLLGPHINELQPSPQTESTGSRAVLWLLHELVHQFGIQEANQL